MTTRAARNLPAGLTPDELTAVLLSVAGDDGRYATKIQQLADKKAEAARAAAEAFEDKEKDLAEREADLAKAVKDFERRVAAWDKWQATDPEQAAA